MKTPDELFLAVPDQYRPSYVPTTRKTEANKQMSLSSSVTSFISHFVIHTQSLPSAVPIFLPSSVTPFISHSRRKCHQSSVTPYLHQYLPSSGTPFIVKSRQKSFPWSIITVIEFSPLQSPPSSVIPFITVSLSSGTYFISESSHQSLLSLITPFINVPLYQSLPS